MARSLVELAKKLTLALVQTGNISAEDLQDTLQKTYATLTALKTQEESWTSAPMPASEPAAVDWRKSISRHVIICLACGLAFKQLSRRHLMTHGLDSRSYRIKYSIPRIQPLAARSTTERHRQVVRETRPWEKAPMYRKGHARHGHSSPEPEAEAVHEEAEELRAEAPVQPKKQRKTTRKKQTPQKKSSQE